MIVKRAQSEALAAAQAALTIEDEIEQMEQLRTTNAWAALAELDPEKAFYFADMVKDTPTGGNPDPESNAVSLLLSA